MTEDTKLRIIALEAAVKIKAAAAGAGLRTADSVSALAELYYNFLTTDPAKKIAQG